MKSLVYAAFIFVSFQAVFLFPYVKILPAERTNIFTAGLALAAAVIAFALRGRSLRQLMTRNEALLWGGVGVFLVVGAGMSPEMTMAYSRVFAFLAPSLAGLACARLLLQSERAQLLAAYGATVLSALFSCAHLVFGVEPSFLGLPTHAIANVLILLAAGQIRLLFEANKWLRGLSVLTMVLALTTCFLAGSRFVILLPFAMSFLFWFIKPTVRKIITYSVLPFALLAGVYFWVFPLEVPKLHNYESVFYRVESYPAAWELVKEHPMFGIGIRTPREDMLMDYEMSTELTSKRTFLGVVKRNVTYDNMVLTMLVGTGIPSTVLLLSLAGLYGMRIVRWARDEAGGGPPRTAVYLPILASSIHFLVHDGLLYPQVCWFFFLLIGLVPLSRERG